MGRRAGADYVSFCSIFHQCPGGQCPIVSLDTVKNATSPTKLSVFAAGGINLENFFWFLKQELMESQLPQPLKSKS